MKLQSYIAVLSVAASTVAGDDSSSRNLRGSQESPQQRELTTTNFLTQDQIGEWLDTNTDMNSAISCNIFPPGERGRTLQVAGSDNEVAIDLADEGEGNIPTGERARRHYGDRWIIHNSVGFNGAFNLWNEELIENQSFNYLFSDDRGDLGLDNEVDGTGRQDWRFERRNQNNPNQYAMRIAGGVDTNDFLTITNNNQRTFPNLHPGDVAGNFQNQLFEIDGCVLTNAPRFFYIQYPHLGSLVGGGMEAMLESGGGDCSVGRRDNILLRDRREQGPRYQQWYFSHGNTIVNRWCNMPLEQVDRNIVLGRRIGAGDGNQNWDWQGRGSAGPQLIKQNADGRINIIHPSSPCSNCLPEVDFLALGGFPVGGSYAIARPITDYGEI